MRRKISLQFALVIILSFLVFIIGSTFIVKQNINQISEMNLSQYLSMIESDIDLGETPEDIVNAYSGTNQYLRITFMDSSGSVIIDSLADQLENHLSRPEFQNLGTAYIRDSATLGKQMMYLASKINDDLYVRVAIPTSSILPFLNDFIGLSILVGIFVTVLAVFLISTLTKNTLKPLKDLSSNLSKVYAGQYEEIMPIDKYEEVNSMINEINEINHLIIDVHTKGRLSKTACYAGET